MHTPLCAQHMILRFTYTRARARHRYTCKHRAPFSQSKRTRIHWVKQHTGKHEPTQTIEQSRVHNEPHTASQWCFTTLRRRSVLSQSPRKATHSCASARSSSHMISNTSSAWCCEQSRHTIRSAHIKERVRTSGLYACIAW